jgi:hypothetical protein
VDGENFKMIYRSCNDSRVLLGSSNERVWYGRKMIYKTSVGKCGETTWKT